MRSTTYTTIRTECPLKFTEQWRMADFEKYHFGKRLLESYGWQSGKGLGRNESGISEALKPTLKFDKAGVGHNHKDDFGFHWWDHVFKKASSNIVVEHSEEGVEMRQKEDDPDLISTKRWKHKKKKHKEASPGSSQLTYGIFTKGSVLTADGEKRDRPEESSSSSSDEDDQLLHRTEDDEALFEACEGRTAHKGARHGLTASGKLQRLAAQENGVILNSVSLSPKPKKNKRKHRDVVEDGERIEPPEDKDGDKERKKKKKKKKKKQSCEIEDPSIVTLETDAQGIEVGNHDGELSARLLNEQKALSEESDLINAEDKYKNGDELTQCDLKKKKKKKKRRCKNEDIC